MGERRASVGKAVGNASTAKIDAGALRLGDDLEASAEGRLVVADATLNVVPLWAGSEDIPATLSADMRSYGVIEGAATAGASPYASVPLTIVEAGQ